MILKRNPNYTGPRPHAFDAIALREGIDPSVAVGEVEERTWDGIVHVFDPILIPTGPVSDEYGDGDPSAEAFAYDATPTPLTGFLAFNASRPAFSDPDVRRAAALAIDRDRLAELFGHRATDQFLPSVLPGVEDQDLYALDGSGLEEARRLMRGRAVSVVMAVEEGSDLDRQMAERVRANLASIGITVEIEELPSREYGRAVYEDRGPEIDLIGAAGEIWYPDPAVFLSDMLTYPVPHGWLPEGVNEKVAALFRLSDAEQRSAAAILADRLATDEVPIAAIWSGAVPTFLSPNLGCRVFPPFGYGVDLAALCPGPA
jgi:ABC-type transport system substrate-binding protein